MPDPKKTKPAAGRKAAASARKPAARKAAGAKKATVKQAAVKKAAAKKVPPQKPAMGRATAKKAPAKQPAVARAPAQKSAVRPAAAATPPPKKPAAREPATARPPRQRTRRADEPATDGQDPEGFFLTRVIGEPATRTAPRPLLEAGGFEEAPAAPAVYDEGLGELPWSHGDDLLVALPRDPRTLFVYWDQAAGTVEQALAGLDHPRVQLWLFVKGAGWERVRVVDFALEARGWYLHDLEPGRHYRAEIHVVDRRGEARLLRQASNAVALPPHGPSPVVDDRFVRIPWDLPLPRLLGPGVPGGPFSDELRLRLARLSDWGRFQAEPPRRPQSGAGGMGGRPSSPSSPFGPFGGEDR